MGRVEGKCYINGRLRTPNSATSRFFKARSGYLLQLAEVFYAQLTVRENLAYAAMMRLPPKQSLLEKMARADAVIHELDMGIVADVRVGDATEGGISGGQKRKLMLGVEILALPAVLFLDEPTSGLDTLAAMEVCATHILHARTTYATRCGALPHTT